MTVIAQARKISFAIALSALSVKVDSAPKPKVTLAPAATSRLAPPCTQHRFPRARPARNAVWITTIDSNFFDSRQQMATELDQLKKIGINEVYVVAWIKGHPLFRAPRAKAFLGEAPYQDPKWAGRDLLAEAVAEAHARKMKVIAWFEGAYKIPVEMRVLQEHPDWAMRTEDGKSHMEFFEEGETRKIALLNPYRREVQDFLTELFDTVVRDYDIDGVQIDDHFAVPREWGHDEYTQDKFRREAKGLTWNAWRIAQLNSLVGRVARAVHDAARAKRRKVEFQVSPAPYKWGLEVLLQDWMEWIRRGYVDVLVPQLYRNTLEAFTRELAAEEIQAACRCVPVLAGQLAGLSTEHASSELIASQVLNSRKNACIDGTSLFFAGSVLKVHSEKPADRMKKIAAALATPIAKP